MSSPAPGPAHPNPLPLGAGGPLRRAAGRAHAAAPFAIAPPPAAAAAARPGAVVVEADGLLRLLVEQAVWALGLRPVSPSASPAASPPVAVFVGLERAEACVYARPRADRDRACAPLRVGYAARCAGLLGAHRLHGCCDDFLELRAGPGGAVFAHPPAASAVEEAGLTAREADVLLLLVAGFTTSEAASRLCVSPATARSHCRAVLRKFGARDRRSLRASLLAAPAGTAGVRPRPDPDAREARPARRPAGGA